MAQNKLFTTIVFFLIAMISSYCYGQNQTATVFCDTIIHIDVKSGKKTILSDLALPSGLIVGGYALWKIPGLDEVDGWVQKQSKKHVNTSTKIDNTLMYTPFVAYWGLDLVGVKARNSAKDRLFLSVGSFAIGQGSIQLLKVIIDRDRPDNSDRKSFPSGHTGTAFIGAHLLMKEYGHTSPWIGISGYTVATATGLLRITNNRHWLSDTVVGAGIGILSVELCYLLMPYVSKSFDLGESDNPLSINPVLSPQFKGLGLSYTF